MEWPNTIAPFRVKRSWIYTQTPFYFWKISLPYFDFYFKMLQNVLLCFNIICADLFKNVSEWSWSNFITIYMLLLLTLMTFGSMLQSSNTNWCNWNYCPSWRASKHTWLIWKSLFSLSSNCAFLTTAHLHKYFKCLRLVRSSWINYCLKGINTFRPFSEHQTI